ncbi:hypothetical protein PHYSODRAFT_301953 [Phytophthora sojae]|uniref:Uncharacterized protein n=1 Tax=Phytophthora sojae (strain P6497) TaxID=1094619 RepID=G4ZNW5_PHYSP|nr:hypothetical protein PHYSODRAFT_301953 [Phytophthora sojae]EGZ15433.1 hypothetical protein PHYSODRAFT_301953 [Phytophthora sojae]|eukprot:XP_009529182.1 hypothetical protein PHYSODRAFT_301953 [Phytophthora sojae]
MYVQPDQTPEPATPILEESHRQTNESNQQWNLASVAYHSLLNAIAIVAGVSMMLVKAGVLNVGDKAAQDTYTEYASQVVNGVFTWTALTSNPGYIYRVITLSRVLKEKTKLESRSQAVRYLNKHFPLAFVDTSPTLTKTTLDPLKSQRRVGGADTDTYMTSKNKLVVCLGNIVFLRNDAKYLRTTFVILNFSCLFQYIMTGFMWGCSAATRPGFVLPALLPPTLLCSVIGEHRINRLSKKIKERRVVIGHGVPILGEIAIKRESMPPV